MAFPRAFLGGVTLCLATLGFAADDGPISFTDLEQTYDGTPKSPTLVLDPPDLPVSLRYTPADAPAPEAPVLFQRYPEVLRTSYSSLSFAAQQTAGLGDLLRFEGSETTATTVDVVLVTWARAINYPTEAAENSEGYEHPISLTFYAVNELNELTLIETTTQDILVPWRPETNPDGSPYTKNGFAFQARFTFDAPVQLATRTMVVVSYDTQNTGFEPIDEPGPYNELNVALFRFEPISAGIDDDETAILWIKNQPDDEIVWSYPATGFASVGFPMFRILGPTPDPSSPDAPSDAGDYLVTATSDDGSGAPLEANTLFTIAPAPATVTLSDLVHIEDGNPKSATATTSPGGLPVTITYDGSEQSPSQLGAYEVLAAISDPNYDALTSGTLIIGYDFSSWSADQVASNGLPAPDSGLLDNPDFDQFFNLAEYAFALDPTMGSPSPIRSDETGGFSIIYQVNRLATDILYTVEATETPNIENSWVEVATTDSILSSDATTLQIRSQLPTGTSPWRFARVAIRQVASP